MTDHPSDASPPDAPDMLEAERRRLAELLNTSVVAPLNLLLSQASAYEQSLGGDTQALMVASVLSMLARQILQQTLDLQASLNPALLTVLGLEAALETLANQISRTQGLDVRLRVARLVQRLPLPLELTIYRAVQDALDVALKAARPSRIELVCGLHEDAVQVMLRHNGLNCDLGRLPQTTLARIAQQRGSMTATDDTLTLRFPVQRTGLTPRETEVLALVAQGLTNKEIGLRLNLSARTVNFHLDNVYSKIGVNTRTEAAVYALHHGLAS